MSNRSEHLLFFELFFINSSVALFDFMGGSGLEFDKINSALVLFSFKQGFGVISLFHKT